MRFALSILPFFLIILLQSGLKVLENFSADIFPVKLNYFHRDILILVSRQIIKKSTQALIARPGRPTSDLEHTSTVLAP